MEIKRLHDFELNEGFLSSLVSGISDLFKSKRSKLESILKQIRKAREEDVAHNISVEKEIHSLPKDNSPEYKFDITNLNRQIRTYSTLKGEEIDSLNKEAKKIIDSDPKLQAFFSAGLAKIESDVTERLIKGLKPYKERAYIDRLSSEFDVLVKDATKKSSYYEDYMEKPERIDFNDFTENYSTSIFNFLDLPNRDAAEYLNNLSKDDLYNLYRELKDMSFDMDLRYKNAIEEIRKDKKRAQKEGQSHLIPSIEQEEIKVKYDFGKPIEKLRSKILLIEKEIKSRKNAAY
jgi:hypothetical protein